MTHFALKNMLFILFVFFSWQSLAQNKRTEAWTDVGCSQRSVYVQKTPGAKKVFVPANLDCKERARMLGFDPSVCGECKARALKNRDGNQGKGSPRSKDSKRDKPEKERGGNDSGGSNNGSSNDSSDDDGGNNGGNSGSSMGGDANGSNSGSSTGRDNDSSDGDGGRPNNGHGNDPDRNDSSNPGRSNNGDGTDADGSPGKSQGRGVSR